MKIYFDGCSFTEGKANLENFEKDRYSKKICEYFNAEEYNFSRGGGSNIRILRNLTNEYYEFIETCDLAIIQLTFRNRLEYFSEETNRWEKVNSGIDRKKNVNEDIRQFYIKYYNMVYNDTFGYAQEEMIFKSIKAFCKSKEIPLILLTVAQPKVRLPYDLIIKGYPTERPNGKGHPTRLGHLLLAKDVINLIKNENLL